MSQTVLISSRIYEVFQPIFVLVRTCCLLPITIKKSGSLTSVSWSWKCYLLSLASATLLVSAIFYGLNKSYQIDDVYNVRMKQFSGMFITILDDSYLILTFVVSTVTTPFTFRHFHEYLRRLNESDKLLKYDHLGDKKKCYAICVLTLTLAVGVLTLDMAMWGQIYLKHVSVWVYLSYNLPFYFTYIIVMAIELYYWCLVHMINVRLRYLNRCMTGTYFQGQLREISDMLSKNVEVREANTASNKTFSNFMRAYESLFEASCALNSLYGVNILMVIVGCLIHLLVTPYDLYLEIKYHDETFIFPQFFWMVSHVLRLLLVVEPCHVAAQEVKIAAATLCKFLSMDLKDRKQLQVEIFVTQLLHCPIQFTACDLIVLDRSLLTAIAGGVTTYLVILFQFENQ